MQREPGHQPGGNPGSDGPPGRDRSGGDQVARPITIALVTDGSERATAALLRDAGLDVVGLLAPEPLESLAWAADAEAPRAYADLAALLSDDVEAVCVELAPPASDLVAQRAAEAGLHVLLARAVTADPAALRAVADVAEDADLAHVVAFDDRAWPAAWHVEASAPALGRLTQMTVVGAPSGPLGRAEVLDLAVRWCGDVLAVCADPEGMPARRLTATAPVTLALLTTSGATVLVHERMGGVLTEATFTLCGERGRIVVEGQQVRQADQDGVRTVWTPAPAAGRSGLAEAAHELVRAVGMDDPAVVRGATVHDLLAVTRLRDAARRSRDGGGWVEL
ncbi:Gfo/Idh/MocA family oxidoreductase [Frankia sp. CNm7]|uniref:Gfo/Idh/MocA family oxidoreductase n=1 Tax=Frankia nepalensis TaxID=1836974 RepID=A0A937RI17_9ACTN|nr:Gfo/Idh/MocA family oxidoreductase [Frankia nepalensis]MBL7514782.1 Gfo/Idh/MocA family oxidoreductase [Frankia nepalensis]MBL7520897.1 Gfo/Idh/MocA family oxidoreductase [Frankia nepalensis]MBL7627729.1 Gfo/Idh/MocA family oxidoreductase [Frankia nepalensis]